jgi:hypothetical protein
MSDLRETLDTILRLCASSRAYTRRVQQIHDVAMRGLGMTAGQREERHMAILDRIGDEPVKAAWLAREAKRKAKEAAYAERESEA